MKKISITVILLFLTFLSYSQSRKYISQFSHFQGYFNPALTAYEGSMVKGFVRNQWAGWEGSPMTYFVSAELDFAELKNSGEFGKNAIGVNLLSDEYGAFRENELIISYSTRVKLNELTALRLGAGINFNNLRLDGTQLTTEQANDPTVMQYFGGYANMSILDFNLGMSLTHPNYYFSYGVHNVNKGSLSSGDVFLDKKPAVSIAQFGYRNELNDQMTVAFNGLWRSQSDLPTNLEFNLKFFLREKIWIGAGHRVDYANSGQIGFLLGKLRVGYVYEWPMVKSYLLPKPTHELMLNIRLFDKNPNGQIW